MPPVVVLDAYVLYPTAQRDLFMWLAAGERSVHTVEFYITAMTRHSRFWPFWKAFHNGQKEASAGQPIADIYQSRSFLRASSHTWHIYTP